MFYAIKLLKDLKKFVEYFLEFCDFVANSFGVTSFNVRILIRIGFVAVALLLVVQCWKLIKKFFVRKKEIVIKNKTGIDNSELQLKIRNEQKIEALTTEYKGKVYEEEKGSGLYFDTLNDLLWGRKYVANYEATILGFIDLSGAETETKEKSKIEVEHVKGLERVEVTVSVPAGYFSTFIDINDVTTEKHEAGLFKAKFSEDDKKKILRKHYYEKVPDIIEKNDLIRLAKRNTRNKIKQIIGGILEGIGYTSNEALDKILKEQNLKLKDLNKAQIKELKIFKTYKVGVKFISTSWKVYRGDKREVLGEVTDPDVTR